MSESRSSIRLSEFFNDDDSEGHRFADFIMKRRGSRRKQKYLFMDCETESLSFDVQLEKLSSPPVKNLKRLSKTQLQKNSVPNDTNIRKGENETIVNKLCQDENEQNLPSESPALGNFVFKEPLHLPVKTVKSIHHSKERLNSSPNQSVRSYNSSIRKIGAALSPSDRLRRLSLKNCSTRKLAAGRRTLLHEFESTIEGTNFNPPICSTPISQPKPNITPSSSKSNQLPPHESIDQNTENASPSSPGTENVEQSTANKSLRSETCCGHTDTLIKSLQRKDAELKDYMDNILDKTLKNIENHSKIVKETSANKTTVNETNSDNVKRTFTVETGSVPGQLVLVPEKITDDQNTGKSYLQNSTNENNSVQRMLSPVTQNSQNNCSKSDAAKMSRIHSLNCLISQSAAKKIQITHSSKQGQKKTPLKEIEKGNLSQNLSIVYPTHNVQVNEALSETTFGENTIIIASGVEQNVVVIPFNRTVSKISSEDKDNINDKSKVVVNNSANQRESLQQAEDNLKLTDILTDDEDEGSKSTPQCLQNTSEMPLNLAPRNYNIRKTRLQSRNSLKHKSHKRDSQKQNTDTEIPPTAHSRKRLTKRKCKPLNKPPGTPLNGEKYAQELSRMSNYEILDLRKRNSMGKIFVISGRKSNRAMEELSKKKLHLCDQIEQELLKRNLQNISKQQLDQANVEDVQLPPPNGFRDSLAAQEQAQNVSNVPYFIDEIPSDRIKFKNNEILGRKAKNKNVPLVLQQYLEVSKRYSTRKRKSGSRSIKRSLFNVQDICTSDEHGSPEKQERYSCTTSIKLSMPFVKSPPKTRKDLITNPKVVSPPPRISSTTSEIENTQNNTHADVVDNITLPPPPPGFDSDSGISSNNNINQYSRNITVEAGEVTTTNASIQINLDNNNDNLFKKPNKPIPKRKVKKIPESSIIQEESTEKNQVSINSNADLTEGGSLRRSKRGQVPICQAPIIGILLQQIEKKQEYYKSRALKKLKESNKNKKLSQRQSSKKNQTMENKLSKNLKNKDAISICTSEAAELEEKRKTRQKKTAKKAKIIKHNDSPQCSYQTLNCPAPVETNENPKQKQNGPPNNNPPCSYSHPPVEHNNNVFDQLRQSSSTSPVSQRLKIKPLEVRVRRLRSSATTPTIGMSNESATTELIKANSNIELVTWLKNMGDVCHADQPVSKTVKEMRISAATNLCFTELQGVEYAFYDTEEKASLGYLRFKPRQNKPRKRAKQFNLHFVNLMGEFRIKTNTGESVLRVGDMVAIEKLTHYAIENLTDDIAILMVIKK